MIKYLCRRCKHCFTETQAELTNVEIDYTPGYGSYCESYITCPECNEHEDIEELNLSKECEEYDEEFGCEGDCDNCPLNQEEEEDEGRE